MSRVAIGVDIGGTSVKLGLVTDKGKLTDKTVFFTKDYVGRAKLMTALSAHVSKLAQVAKSKKLKVAGVGIGAPGPIDAENGFVYFFPNIAGWKNTPIKKILEKKLRMKVCVDNDANAMALAEYRFGAGRGARNMIGVTLGTGVGGGIVVKGKLFHGSHYSAAEIGHIIINENGPLCGCGNHGCIEAYVGNGHLVTEIKKRLDRGEKSILKKWIAEGKELTPKLVKESYRAGDVFSAQIWEEFGDHLGTALAGLVNVLNPDRIVIGGGVSLEGEMIFRKIRQTIAKKAFPIAAQSVKVVPAVLGADAGLVGAAALAL